MTEIKKVVVTQNNVDATAAKKTDDKKQEEKSMASSLWEGTLEGIETVKEYSGWNALTEAQDKKDARVELWTKETDGAMYPLALLGNVAAQPTDVVSCVGEVATKAEWLDEKIAKLDPKEINTDKGQFDKSVSDLARSGGSVVKLWNASWNMLGGTSDIVSSGLKLENITNEMIAKSTFDTQDEIANFLSDFSEANLSDKKTVIDVATRLGMTQEQLKKMEDEKGADAVRELIKKEFATAAATGKLPREVVLMTSANVANKELVDKNANLIVDQFNPGVDKLDKGFTQFREGTSELLNLPAATLDLTNSGIRAGVRYVAGDTAAEIADAPLQAVSGLLQVVTTSWDGKEGTTVEAFHKTTFGAFRDTPEEAKFKKEVKTLEADLDAKEDAVDELEDKLEDLKEEYEVAKNGKSGFLGIGAKEKDEAVATELAEKIKLNKEELDVAQAKMLLAKLALATKEKDEDDIAEVNEEIKAFNAKHPGLIDKVKAEATPAPVKKAEANVVETPVSKADAFKKKAMADFEAKKMKVGKSDATKQSLTENAYEIQKGRVLASCRAAVEKEAQKGPTIAHLKAKNDFEALVADLNDPKTKQKWVAKKKAELTDDDMQGFWDKAQKEYDKLVKGEKIDNLDAKRLAQRAENRQVSTGEDGKVNETLEAFYNSIDRSYSNADNTAGDRGLLNNTLSVLKGIGMTVPRALLAESVTTVDKAMGAVVCPEIAGVAITGYTGTKKLTNGIKTIYNATYNSAAKKAGYEETGEALAYYMMSTAMGVVGLTTDSHCWHLTKHGHRGHFDCGGHGNGTHIIPKPPIVEDTACDILGSGTGSLPLLQ